MADVPLARDFDPLAPGSADRNGLPHARACVLGLDPGGQSGGAHRRHTRPERRSAPRSPGERR